MKKALVLVVLGLMVGVAGYGQATFVRNFKINGANNFSDIELLANGNYLCTGAFTNSSIPIVNGTQPFGLQYAIYSPTGQLLSYFFDSSAPFSPAKAMVTMDNGIAFLGISEAGNHRYFLTMKKFDFSNNLLWEKRCSDTIHYVNPISMVQAPDSGLVFAIGKEVQKISINGDSIWNYQITIDGGIWGLINTLDGGYLVTGVDTRQAGYYTVFATKLDSSGAEEWRQDYNVISDFNYAVQKGNGNYIIMANYDDSINGGYTPLVMEVDVFGNLLNTKYFSNKGQGFFNIVLANDGGVLLGGRVTDGFTEQIYITKIDSQLNDVWEFIDTLSFGYPAKVLPTPDAGVIAVGRNFNNAWLIKIDSLGNIQIPIVKGKVVHDRNVNCVVDTQDLYLANHLVKVQMDSTYYGYTDYNGEFEIRVEEVGAATVYPFAPNDYWATPSCQTSSFPFNIYNSDTIDLDVFAIPTIHCPDLSVTLNTRGIRRCFTNTYSVNYCNNGTLPANSAYLEIEMDPYLTVDSASIPWVSNTGNLYRFNLDTVGIGQCGSFNLYVTVDCNGTELGQTHCVSAHIYPDSICLPPDPAWDGSSVAVTGSCDTGDTLDFKIENVGGSDMTSPSFFLIAEDNVMYQSGNFQLLSGDSLKYRFKGNGSTFTLLAQQVEGHPGRSFPMVSIEGCGTNNQGTFGKGFKTQYPQDDQNGYVDVLCLQNVASYDPNDKRAEPQGLNTEGFITAEQPLDYTVRFQNTGTDTAFTVVLRDTLSAKLDITTLYLNGASHPYTFQIIGSNVLEWTFANILLPDSNINEPLSHGFVSFHIQQNDGNTPGTEITNRAGIYFDFNAAVLTNTTLNTIINDYKTWFTFVQSPESKLQLGIYPNPNNGTFSLDFATKANADYQFVIYDLAGAKQFGQTLSGTAPYVLQPDLPTGMYIYQLLEDNQAVGIGKVVVNR